MNRTIIKACSCKNKFQDGRYGAGLRVMNFMGKTTSAKAAKKAEENASSEDTKKPSSASGGYRCTVCATKHS